MQSVALWDQRQQEEQWHGRFIQTPFDPGAVLSTDHLPGPLPRRKGAPPLVPEELRSVGMVPLGLGAWGA